jgi:hypothetical protein
LEQPEAENGRLKKLVGYLSLEKQLLKGIAGKNTAESSGMLT